MAVQADYNSLAQQIYIAYFGRPADYTGLNNMTASLLAANVPVTGVAAADTTAFVNAYSTNTTIKGIIDNFGTSTESLSYFGTGTNEAFVNAIFLQILGRSPLLAGLSFWSSALSTGAMTRGEAALRIMEGALANTSTQGLVDAAGIANKTTAAASFTNGMTTTADVLGYQGTAAAATARTWLSTVTDDAATLTTATSTVATTITAINTATSTVTTTGTTFTLTTGVDQGTAFTGTAGADSFVSNFDIEAAAGAGAHTLGGLDALDGGAGTDTLAITNDTGAYTMAAATIANIENITIQGAAGVTADVSGSSITGLESVAVTKSTTAVVTAATTTDVTVSGAAGAITVDGGKNVSVSDATSAQDITIGGTTVNAGTITVTDSKVGAGTIKIDGGTNVTLTATGSSGGGDTFEVGNGGAATDLPSGVVGVTSAHTGVAATDVVLNAITAKGGSTITVTQTSDTAKAATDTTGATLTQGAVTVAGGDATTSVTVVQAKSTTEVIGLTAVAGVTETASVKFSALTTGQTLVMGGLTLTASADMTAAEAAAAFASLTKGFVPTVGTTSGDTQGAGSAAKGMYTGYLNGWTSGTVSTDTVVFTSTTASTDVGDLANAGTGTATVTTAAGSAATAAKTGVLGVIDGVVTIDDNATASITTVSVDGYGDTSKIGNTSTLSKLATLTLANSGGATAGATDGSMTVDAAGVATLNVSLNNIKGTVSLDGASDSALKTVNLTATGANSSFALTAAAAETLTIAGDKALTLSTGTFTALKSITVSGSAGATFDGDEADTLTSVTTSATTGSVTATIDGTKATYTGGAGVDTVTLATGTALTKAIDLGAGDDTLSFAALNVTGSTAAVAGGDGTDTLSMAAATAANLDGAIQSFYTGFERLTINDAGGSQTIDLANLGFTNYVKTTGGTITLDKLANNGTVVLNAATTATTVQITDAADATKGLADVLNVTTNVSTADLNFGTLTAADVETININADDTSTTAAINTATLALVATKATKIVVTGDSNLTLTNSGNTKVAEIDGSAMTGVLTVQAAGVTASTIKGGSAADVLTASGGAGGGTAQVSTLTFTDGAGNAAMVGTDSISVTIGTTTVSQAFNTDWATTLAALEIKTEAIASEGGYTTSVVGSVLTITSDVKGAAAFTADATFTQGTASSITSVYAAGAVTEGTESNVVTFGALTAGQTLIIGGLTLTDDGSGATAAEVAAAFASIANGGTGNAGVGAFGGTLTNWSSSALTGVTAVFTSAFTNSNVTDLTIAGTGAGASGLAKTEGINDIDTLTLTEAVAITAGDTITATVTNGVSTYTTAAVAFNTNYATTMGDLATAIQGLNGAASFTAAYVGGVISVTDAVAGVAASGSPITAISTSTVVNQVTSVTDVFATTTASVTAIGDTLIGNDGADTLTSGAALGIMTGGAGQDLFVVGAPSSNVNSYTTITDFTSSDLLKFASAVNFKSATVPLGSTAQFTDWANAAINALQANEVGWFNYGTDTYVLMDVGNTTAFVNGTDFIVKLTGTFDLSTATFNNTYDTIAL